MENIYLKREGGSLLMSDNKDVLKDFTFELSENEVKEVFFFMQKNAMAGELLDRILDYTCLVCKVSKPLVMGKSREMRFVVPRQIYCYLARKSTNSSLSTIGALIKRDHATVKHSVKVIEIYQELHYKKVTDLVDNILNFFNDG